MWGAGSAGMVVGTIFGIAALSAKSTFDDHPTYSQADTVHNYTIASDVGFGAGLVLLLGGTMFYFIDDKDEAAAPQAKNKSNSSAQIAFKPILSQQTRGGSFTLKF
jgi:hypothetical protein